MGAGLTEKLGVLLPQALNTFPCFLTPYRLSKKRGRSDMKCRIDVSDDEFPITYLLLRLWAYIYPLMDCSSFANSFLLEARGIIPLYYFRRFLRTDERLGV
jgi:hypothetical protein